jgi:hypothetical protein
MVDLTGVKSSFVFAVVFVAVFALLITLGVQSMPLVFSDSVEQDYFTSPEYFNIQDIEDIATVYNITANNGGSYFEEEWGIDEGFGHHFRFRINEVSGQIQIANEHYYVFYVLIEIPYGHHNMEWIGRDNGVNYGEYLDQDDFEAVNETSGDITSSRYRIACDHVTMHASVAYNSSLYDNATHAFQNDALTCVFGIDWDEMGTGMNAYSLISQIMTFQRPEIHPALNSLVAIPLWALIGFLVVIIILAIVEALPFT